jgi:hypothetical protein
MERTRKVTNKLEARVGKALNRLEAAWLLCLVDRICQERCLIYKTGLPVGLGKHPASQVWFSLRNILPCIPVLEISLPAVVH